MLFFLFTAISISFVFLITIGVYMRKKKSRQTAKAIIGNNTQMIKEKIQKTNKDPLTSRLEYDMVLHNTIMSFTRTHQQSKHQLPLIGLPDESLFRIH